ncbi:hypothetical protein M758_2G032900 [Ceratodon purpureus]|nr:hypothetical protein M758_2G032900 [Ceratodon purpureus]
MGIRIHWMIASSITFDMIVKLVKHLSISNNISALSLQQSRTHEVKCRM